ncbi:hypothetical protein [Dyella ginsengisoli]|uniref:hypothetical protein n=1 Tax=Dyella ginsengisoli TaxID=363848 RepID=UPI0012FD3791|nr:hypothetical protein [Dyella ginsengisoli]
MDNFGVGRGCLALALGLVPALVVAGQVAYQDPNTDREICPDFYKVVNGANLSKLTDDELCNFRFSNLGFRPSRDFSTPKWVVLDVKDPVATYEKMVNADYPAYGVKTRPVADEETLNKISSYYKDGYIEFVKSNVPMVTYDVTSSRVPIGSITLVEMRYRRCPVGNRNAVPAPYFAAFYDTDLNHPMVANGMSISSEIVIWKGWVPIALTYPDRWLAGDDSRKGLFVNIDSVWKSPMRRGGWEILGGKICGYTVNKG